MDQMIINEKGVVVTNPQRIITISAPLQFFLVHLVMIYGTFTVWFYLGAPIGFQLTAKHQTDKANNWYRKSLI